MKPTQEKRTLKGYLLLITAFITCPCYLPLILALLGGTALGGFIAANQTLIFVVALVYFLFALIFGLKILSKEAEDRS